MAQKNILVTVAVVAAAAANPGTCVATKCAGALARRGGGLCVTP